MNITPFSIILIAICIGIIFKSKNLFDVFKNFIILTLIVSLNVNMGYFIKIGSNYYTYEIVLETLTFLTSLIIIINIKKLPKKI